MNASNQQPPPRQPRRTWRVSRRLDAVQVQHRGRKRALVVELDTRAGTLCVRLQGCRKRRKYLVADLYQPGQQMALSL